MSGLILEALLALVILLAIVWWTMFSGRPRGEVPRAEEDSVGADTPGAAAPPSSVAPKD